MIMIDSASMWLIGVTAALLAGLNKTGLPGCGILAVPLMAFVFPAKLSVGALLPLLIIGDICAVFFYHRHAQWNKLLELFPCVVGGIAAGALVLWKMDSSHLKPVLGALILLLVLVEIWRRRSGWSDFPHKMWFVVLMGSLAGFATTLGNAAGPIMNIYFISKGFKKDEFMGTIAWYFLIFNCVKIPIYFCLGMITPITLKFDLFMLPAVLTGALAGRLLLGVIPQKAFNIIILCLAAAAAIRLLF